MGLDGLRRRFWDDPAGYPRGTGPLDALLDGLRDRKLTAAAARERAIQPDTAGLLSNTYIKVAHIHRALSENTEAHLERARSLVPRARFNPTGFQSVSFERV